MHLELEKDGRLTADTKLGRTLTAASAEDERNGLYRGQYLLTEEGVYRFRIGSWPEAGAGGYDTSAALGAFSDGAGNILEGLGDTAVTEGFYMSPVIIIDRTAPEVSFRWLDAEGQEISGRRIITKAGNSSHWSWLWPSRTWIWRLPVSGWKRWISAGIRCPAGRRTI